MDIGDILLAQGVVTRDQLSHAQQASTPGKRIDQALVDMGVVTEDRVLKALADELGMRFVEVDEIQIDRDLLGKFPAREIFKHTLFPVSRRNGTR
jgi:hypothetical protein